MLTRENAVEFWETRYHDAHTPWDRGTISPALRMWLSDGALTPDTILVPGCGNGYEVVELAQRGFNVTAVDIAPSPLAALSQALAEVGACAALVEADLLNWRPTQPFAAVYEQTCLCALVPELWPRYAEQLAAWLCPGGHLYACFMQTDGQGGPPFHCALHDMRGLFPPETWLWPAQAAVEIPHPAGIHELALVLTRRE
ncbi:MAG: TPMT family class I SAM-dependent methyltransferase [Gammaproteobacteria bacterium]|nr:TPMT family class I SAM-dependent methyltransferase [Gammaproteobacteria bacterium]